MAGLSRTKATSGGISVPIGGTVSLLDTATAVTKGDEQFLQNGTTSTTDTYANAVVRTFMSTATHVNEKTYSSYLTPYGVTGTQSILVSKNGAAVSAVDDSPLGDGGLGSGSGDNSNGLHDIYLLDFMMSPMRLHHFTQPYSGHNDTCTWQKTVDISTVIGGTSKIGNYNQICGMQVMPHKTTADNSSVGPYASLSAGNSSTVNKLAIATTGSNNSRVYLSYLNRSTLALESQVVLGDYNNEGDTYMRNSYQTTTAVGWFNFTECYTGIYDNTNDYMEITKWNSQTGARIAYGDSSSYRKARWTGSPNSGQVYNWTQVPEFVPFHTTTTANSYTQTGWIFTSSESEVRMGVRTTDASSNDYIRYFYSSGLSGVAYNLDIADNYQNGVTERMAPHMDVNYGLCYMDYAVHPPKNYSYSAKSTVKRTWPSRHSGTDYTCYAYDGSANVLVGNTTENKIFNIHPTTFTRSSAKDISTQANYPPKFLVGDGTHVYNVYGDGSYAPKVYKYQISNGANIANYAIDSYITGTNVAGIARDSGGNFYILDSSNMRLHKWNSSWVYQSYVTIATSDTGSFTPRGIASDGTDFFIYDSTNNVYRLFLANGTYTGGNVGGTTLTTDLDYYSGHLFSMSNGAAVTAFTVHKNVVGVPTSGVGTTYSQYTRVG